MNCEEGCAYISLQDNYKTGIIGSLVDVYYSEIPLKSVQINNPKYKSYIITKGNLNTCIIKADIISSNSLILRLYEYQEDDDETDYVPFIIGQSHLEEIARDLLTKL